MYLKTAQFQIKAVNLCPEHVYEQKIYKNDLQLKKIFDLLTIHVYIIHGKICCLDNNKFEVENYVNFIILQLLIVYKIITLIVLKWHNLTNKILNLNYILGIFVII